MYLNGEFGSDPNAVNPFAASAFYTVDRYASYKKNWAEFYLSGGIIVADRYTTSNMVHQAAKIMDAALRSQYLDWLWDFEFTKCGLPVPDCVVFLNMPPAYSQQLLHGRAGKHGESQQDIHERNQAYLAECYDNACAIARQYQWQEVNCVEQGRLRTVDEIHSEIYAIVKKIL
jgi:dTMP kinase